MLLARFRQKREATATFSFSFRVWITDIDVSIMNNAAIMTVFECGRIDAMVRSGFFKTALNNKWYFPSQAISVQYYRPLKIFQKAKVYSRICYVDEKWIYIEQKINRGNKLIAGCIVKNTVKNGRETVPTSKLMEALKVENYPIEKLELIKLQDLENLEMNERLKKEWPGI